jgi:hypothetical protein
MSYQMRRGLYESTVAGIRAAMLKLTENGTVV